MKNLGIKSKVVLLAVLPVTLLAVWLSYIEISNHFATLDTSLNIRADAIARNLARSSEVAINAENQDLLDQLSLATLLEQDVLSVDIMTHDSSMHAHAEQFAYTTARSNVIKLPAINHSPELIFEQPIIATKMRLTMNEDDSLLLQSDPLTEANDIGMVTLKISTNSIALEKQESLINSISITLLAVLLTSAFGLLIGRAITKPIVELSDAVERIEKGDLNIQLKATSSGEIKTLQSGFTTMANTIKASQAALIDEVDQATSELRQTLKTVEKQNVALESAREKEHKSNQAKSEFLANISHEIRTPMNAVLGFADILNQTHLDEQQTEYISTIKKSGEHLISIINDILDLSRIEAGKLSINPIDFNLRACIEEVIQLLAPQAHENNNELVMLVYNDVPDQINGDPLRIKQILLNLLHNALKFTQSGSVVLRVMDEGHDAKNITLGINVEDNGIGIEASEISKLFTAYSMSQHNPDRRSGGTGLGLSITHKLVESMGGTIDVESTLQKGTTFHCVIKVKTVEKEISTSIIDKPLLGKHIVIFDNHSFTRLATVHMLNRAGAEKIDALECSAMKNYEHSNGTLHIVILSLPRTGTIETDMCLSSLSSIKTDMLCLLVPQIEKPALETYQEYGVDIVVNRPVREDHLINLLSKRNTARKSITNTNEETKTQAKKEECYCILIADDHEINLRVVSNILERHGHQYQLANGGIEAIRLADQQHFDMIFMDIHMPDITGVDAVKHIRSQSRKNQNTPIVALTADAISLSLHELIDIGFNDRLIKPVTEHDLSYQLDHWLNKSKLENKKAREQDEKSGSIVNELRAMLLKELPVNLVQLENFKKNDDLKGIYELAHRLHSASCYVDWPNLKAASNTLESNILNEQDPDKIQASTAHLTDTITQLIENNA